MWTGLVCLRIGTGGEFLKLSSVQTTKDLSSSAQLLGVSYVSNLFHIRSFQGG
jgi:hypothetical protein